MLSKLTDLCITKSGKWITLVIWLVFASVVIGLSPSLDTSANTADFLPDDVESTKAYELSASRFASQGIPVIVVFRNENGLSLDDYKIDKPQLLFAPISDEVKLECNLYFDNVFN